MGYSKELKKQFIEIIKKSDKGLELNSCEASMLFHYARNKDEPQYQFVKDYFESKTKKKKIKKEIGDK